MTKEMTKNEMNETWGGMSVNETATKGYFRQGNSIIDVGDLPDGIIDVGDLPGGIKSINGIIDVGDLPDG